MKKNILNLAFLVNADWSDKSTKPDFWLSVYPVRVDL